ncbi:MAG TPA: gas vesicle protein [Longimicrobiales bacterium]|nr:gas vesicle protein [Longimicrobiales bacterium]
MAERALPAAGRAASERERVALVELVNRVVDKGVVLSGELTISVADVDLLYVGLNVLLCSADRVSSRVALRGGRPPPEAPGGEAREGAA